MPFIRSSIVSFTLLVTTATAAHAQSPAATPVSRPGFDPFTGRDLLNYPPHRGIDILHQRIEMVIPDMNVPQASAATYIRFAPIASDVHTFSLQAAELNIRSVVCEGRQASFVANPGDDRLEIRLDPPLPKGETGEIRIEYEILNPPDGLRWTPASSHRPGQAASLHTQGQTELNRYWFPTHDFPNERFSSEVVVTVPSGFTAVSNGRLMSREHTMMPAQPDREAERFHYLLEQEHAPYLVSLAVGQWDVVDVSTFGDRLPMPVYVPSGQESRVQAVFSRTPKMISLFERLFGEPYPWPQYAQVVVPNLSWGGMENTSATNLYDTIVFDKTAALDGDEDILIAHELAHQWFGNLITCRSWEHLWLNEGWATYAEALWEQYKGARVSSRAERQIAGPGSDLKPDHDAYQFAIWSAARSVIEGDTGAAPHQCGMASKAYPFPDAVFDRPADPYNKGALALHMLRQQLTDPVFWRGVDLYTSRHRGRAVETYDFRTCMEEVSGLSLQRFFDQWCTRPGIPRLKVSTSWNAEPRTLTITVEQTQTIDGPNPAYAFDLPIWIDDGSGRPTVVSVSTESRIASMDVPLTREPRRIVVDPELHVLASVELIQPADAFVETLARGPTLVARLEAARQLGSANNERGIDALAAMARDTKAHQGLRVESLKSIAAVTTAEPPLSQTAAAALIKLSRTQISDARVRKQLTTSLGQLAGANPDSRSQTTASLLERWQKDPSNAVRAESLRALGNLKSVDAIPAFAKGIQTDSHADVIRVGAIEGLASSRFPDALDQCIGLTIPSHSNQARRAAIAAIPKLATADPERAFNILAALVNDNEYETRRAAVEAMLDLDDPRARLTVEQWADAARSRMDRLWALDLLERHARAQAESGSNAAASP